MESLAERERDLPIAVPGQLDDRGLGPGQLERGDQPRGIAAGVEHQVDVAGGHRGRREADPERIGQRAAGRVPIDQLDAGTRRPRGQVREQPTDDAEGRPDGV